MNLAGFTLLLITALCMAIANLLMKTGIHGSRRVQSFGRGGGQAVSNIAVLTRRDARCASGRS